jgi:hypothetical protein
MNKIAIALLGLITGLAIAPKPQAIQARVMGYCEGKLWTAVEEDNLPSRCKWVEGIRYHAG